MILTPKLFGKILAFFVFACSIASINASAAPNNPNPRAVLQNDVMIHQGSYNGYKGYRHHRFGYQRHSDGWWYPKAAFNNIPSKPPHALSHNKQVNAPYQPLPKTFKQPPHEPNPSRNALSQRHIRWCSERYRTYRAQDNSFAIKKNIRRSCISPFKR